MEKAIAVAFSYLLVAPKHSSPKPVADEILREKSIERGAEGSHLGTVRTANAITAP